MASQICSSPTPIICGWPPWRRACVSERKLASQSHVLNILLYVDLVRLPSSFAITPYFSAFAPYRIYLLQKMYSFSPVHCRAEFLSRLKSVLPLTDAHALPEPSLPTTFEHHCPGGLKTLARKARTLEEEGPTKASAAGQTFGKRNREHGSETLQDGALGAAAAIAVFGWQLAPTAPQDIPSVSSQVKATDTAGGGNKGGGRKAGDAPQSPAASGGKRRLWCTVCNRRVLTDNFLAADSGSSGATAASVFAASSASVESEGDSRGTKRRRVSGGGTPLKAMDLVAEHRSFCPWANVHPVVEGEDVSECRCACLAR